MSLIVDEQVKENLTKEEVLLLALNEASDKKAYEKALFLYKNELYTKEVVENFNEDNYVEVYPKTIKGYSLVRDEEGNLYLVKAMKADEETDVFGYDVLSLANPTDEEMVALHHHYKRPCVLKAILFVGFVLAIIAGLVATFFVFFENVQNASTGETQIGYALSMAYMYAGGFVTVSIGLLLLILNKNKKCCRK